MHQVPPLLQRLWPRDLGTDCPFGAFALDDPSDWKCAWYFCLRNGLTTWSPDGDKSNRWSVDLSREASRARDHYMKRDFWWILPDYETAAKLSGPHRWPLSCTIRVAPPGHEKEHGQEAADRGEQQKYYQSEGDDCRCLRCYNMCNHFWHVKIGWMKPLSSRA